LLRCLEPENCNSQRNRSEEEAVYNKIHGILACESNLESIKKIASSRTLSIWQIKRAKIILGIMEKKSIEKMVVDLRVPPNSIIKSIKQFAITGLEYFNRTGRKPTSREASVEKLLSFLENPYDDNSDKWDQVSVKYIGHYFSARQIQRIRDFIKSNPESNQNNIAKKICLMFGIYQSNGEIKRAQMAVILKRMEMDNVIFLPPVRRSPSCKKKSSRKKKIQKVDTRERVFSQSDIEQIQFIPAFSDKDLALWRQLIEGYHYISNAKLFGAQMRYLVYGGKGIQKTDTLLKTRTKDTIQGEFRKSYQNLYRGKHLLAVIGFAAGSWSLSSRDKFIGWDKEQREANLKYIVNNVRFLILPWVKSPNLASRILGGIARQLPFDWAARYNYKPLLLETFVQLDRFNGTCYRAANWTQIGETKGYSFYPQNGTNIPRAVFVYPLCKNFRKKLLHEDNYNEDLKC
jgi:hypothetical protein